MRMGSTAFTTFSAAILALTASSASAGVIYVDDSNAGAIYKYTTGGVRSTFAAPQGTTDIGLAVSPSGVVYAAYRDSNQIIQYSAGGAASVFANVSSPYGMAIDAAGNVYTAANSGTIMKYTPGGVGSVFATGVNAFSLAFDASGNLFDGEQNTGSILEFTPAGTRSTFASGIGTLVGGLAFDGAGNLYAADWNSEILKFTAAGARSTFATFSTSLLPTGLVYDLATQNLYMSEVANGISQPGQQGIYAFSPAGVQSTFATGLYTPYGIADLQQAAGATPEPGTLLLVAGGIAIVGLGRKQRAVSRSRFSTVA